MYAWRMHLLVATVAVVVVGAARAQDFISVVRQRVTLEEEHEFIINNTVEYILEFIPSGEQGEYPSRLRVRTWGGDTARPLLLTARQTTGAQTWQLPYVTSTGELATELERTLCPYDAPTAAPESGDHACGEGGEVGVLRGQFALHAASACGTPLRFTVRAQPVRDWRLHFATPHNLHATATAPAVRHYAFSREQSSVRLVFASDDDVCASLSVHTYSCPIPESLSDVSRSGLRMTVQRSGAVQLARSMFPLGFVVVSVVHDTDACGGQHDAVWSWQQDADNITASPPPRSKDFTLTVQASLTPREYAAATCVLAALLLAFYVAFGALVAAQRLPACRRLTAPRAVLADPPSPPTTGADADAEADTSPARRRRRDSTATYDSSDNSDSDDDEPARAATPPPHQPSSDQTDNAGTELEAVGGRRAEGVNGLSAGDAVEGGAASRPFGLPARLNVAALARRRGRTLRARSDRYLYTLYTVAVFYALPVVQFVIAFQIVLNVSGSLDLCYYNFLCAHPAGLISDFNHVFSNLGYVLLGALFILQVRRRRTYRRRHPKHEEYGIPAHYGMLTALGAGMMVVALLSASYHVCPNQLNFQFDTAFMYVLAVLSMVKIYQSRHPDVNARAHATFGVLAALIALVVWGVLGGGALFWGTFTVLHVFAVLLVSLSVYYVGQFRLDKQSLTETRRGLRDLRPLYATRLVLLLIANAVNWLFALYGLFTMPSDFAGHLLTVLLGNTLLYMLFYLAMKLVHGERLRWYAWCWLGAAAAAWVPALYFFTYGSSDWSATPAASRHLNHACKVMQFYDSHDLWHLLSAVALYFSFNAMLTWDDGLSAVKRTDIAVF